MIFVSTELRVNEQLIRKIKEKITMATKYFVFVKVNDEWFVVATISCSLSNTFYASEGSKRMCT